MSFKMELSRPERVALLRAVDEAMEKIKPEFKRPGETATLPKAWFTLWDIKKRLDLTNVQAT